MSPLRPTSQPRRRFSSTVSEGNSRRPSGTSMMPEATIASVAWPTMSSPAKRMRPFDAVGLADDRLQQRGFAGAVGADDGDDLAGADANIDMVNGAEFAIENG